mmetsp:Transcript_55990/g.133416  ORF Transcript_55990/g.133416 Transcript_55990/m.133416 type:complete len:229 (+) Transcript_55990:364-1050(+)
MRMAMCIITYAKSSPRWSQCRILQQEQLQRLMFHPPGAMVLQCWRGSMRTTCTFLVAIPKQRQRQRQSEEELQQDCLEKGQLQPSPRGSDRGRGPPLLRLLSPRYAPPQRPCCQIASFKKAALGEELQTASPAVCRVKSCHHQIAGRRRTRADVVRVLKTLPAALPAQHCHRQRQRRRRRMLLLPPLRNAKCWAFSSSLPKLHRLCRSKMRRRQRTTTRVKLADGLLS